ncbi:MAG: hypothetical protein ACI3VB_01520 [Oscillospiraceae bacterium]
MLLQNQLLLASAARLYSLGMDLEGAREELKRCVALGVPYSSPEMLCAYENFTYLKAQFDSLEREHLLLRSQQWGEHLN